VTSLTKPLKDETNICFGCSPNNPIGLKMKFEEDGDVCRAYYTARPEHMGWNDVVHGGLVATMLDEAMGRWLWVRNLITMTAEMTIRYSKPVPVGVRLIVESSGVSQKGKLIEMTARIILPDGSLAARARAKFLKVGPGNLPEKGDAE